MYSTDSVNSHKYFALTKYLVFNRKAFYQPKEITCLPSRIKRKLQSSPTLNYITCRKDACCISKLVPIYNH